jgi:hypothetical protein
VTEIEVEEADLSDEGDGNGSDGYGSGAGGGGGDDDGGEEGRGHRNGGRSDGFLRTLLSLVTRLARALVSNAVGYELSRVRRRIRVLGALALTFLVLGILASVVWLLVGVAFLAESFPAAANPLVFAAGGVVGYLAAVVAGVVYR